MIRRASLRTVPAVVLAVLAIGWLAAVPVRAAAPTFGTPTIEGSLGNGLEFTQPITLDAVPDRVELLLTYADATGPLVVEVPPPAASGRPRSTTRCSTATATSRRTRRSRPAGGSRPRAWSSAGPRSGRPSRDDRFAWKTVQGDVVRVHWYDGDRAFGERALRIGERADAPRRPRSSASPRTRRSTSSSTREQAAFYDALGPGTRENVGGQANSSIRTLFALIPPAQIDDPWVANVVPARTRPPRVRHRGEQPLSLPAAMAQRGSGHVPVGGLRRRRSRRGRAGRSRRRPHPARRDRRPVPDLARALRAGLRRERLRGRLHRSHARLRGARVAHPVVRGRAHRRRGLRGRHRAGRGGLQRRLAGRPRSGRADPPRTAARAARSAAGRLGRGRAGPAAGGHGRARRVGAAGRPGSHDRVRIDRPAHRRLRPAGGRGGRRVVLLVMARVRRPAETGPPPADLPPGPPAP